MYLFSPITTNEYYNAADNNLGGSIPDDIRLLTKMTMFDVYMNFIGSTIPSILEELTDLATLDLEENMFTGPAFVPVSKNVTNYRVSLNDCTGTIPDLSEFEGLTELWAAGNNLAGGLPTTIGRNTKLASLIIYDAGLTGTIPSELGELDLEQFTAQRNSFTGTIPEELYQNTNLRDFRCANHHCFFFVVLLSFDSCCISFRNVSPLPIFQNGLSIYYFFPLCTVPRRLDQNMLTGTLSTRLGDLEKLEDLRLGENGFTGTLPPQITRLMQLSKRYCSRRIDFFSLSLFLCASYSLYLCIFSFLQKSFWSTTPTWKG